jgi:hypothetical protein
MIPEKWGVVGFWGLVIGERQGRLVNKSHHKRELSIGMYRDTSLRDDTCVLSWPRTKH